MDVPLIKQDGRHLSSSWSWAWALLIPSRENDAPASIPPIPKTLRRVRLQPVAIPSFDIDAIPLLLSVRKRLSGHSHSTLRNRGSLSMARKFLFTVNSDNPFGAPSNGTPSGAQMMKSPSAMKPRLFFSSYSSAWAPTA
jgi:hypothetical protein